MSAVFPCITVPVDGSTTSDRGVAFALELASGGGTVHFCSVVDEAMLCVSAAEGAAVDIGPMIATLNDDAEIFCREAVALATARGIRSDVDVLHGSRVEAVHSFAKSNGSAAIVIGTHARTGLSRAVLGSVTEGLIRSSDLPVVVVHEDDETRTGPVVIALDDSPAAADALEVAIGMSCARGRALAIVHVIESRASAPRDSGLLDRAVAHASEQGLTPSIVIVRGSPAEKLIEAAEELESCMIVMGTHGRTLVPRLLLGSVAESVVRRAHVPVTTVRHTDRAGRNGSGARTT
ncbi:MAG: universal stress protein [Candidatus Velthaea sp.]|jgi:nucleotide-binding universal stress UspA family protein